MGAKNLVLPSLGWFLLLKLVYLPYYLLFLRSHQDRSLPTDNKVTLGIDGTLLFPFLNLDTERRDPKVSKSPIVQWTSPLIPFTFGPHLTR